MQRQSALLAIPAAAWQAAESAVGQAQSALGALVQCSEAQVSSFFEAFADRLTDTHVWQAICAANARDVAAAQARGHTVGRLGVSEKMRQAMIAGLRGWASVPSQLGAVVERRQGDDFSIERRRVPLGVVAFVFEGRPNVLADGAGVLRFGNAAVMRIGSDAQGTADALAQHALTPALASSGLPQGAISLVQSRDRAAAQALFAQPGVALAVARGSGPAVSLLGAIAAQSGIPCSLHGTGGAWMLVEASCTPGRLRQAIEHSLDRKVCNTLNTLVLTEEASQVHQALVRDTLASLKAQMHVTTDARRAGFDGTPIREEALNQEWEWDERPELSLAVARDLEAACTLCNAHSPRFVVSVLTGDEAEAERCFRRLEAPYCGNAFTRWVDGQWAWQRPELGLTNWEQGRLMARSGILTGSDIYSIREVFHDTTGKAAQQR